MPWAYYNAAPTMTMGAQPWLMGRGARNMGAPLYPPGNNGSKGKGKAKGKGKGKDVAPAVLGEVAPEPQQQP